MWWALHSQCIKVDQIMHKCSLRNSSVVVEFLCLYVGVRAWSRMCPGKHCGMGTASAQVTRHLLRHTTQHSDAHLLRFQLLQLLLASVTGHHMSSHGQESPCGLSTATSDIHALHFIMGDRREALRERIPHGPARR